MKRLAVLGMVIVCLLCVAVLAQADQAAVGTSFKDFTVTKIDGGTFSLSGALSAGKPVFVNMFATWCGPCLHEFPALEEAYGKYRDRVAVIVVTVDPDDTAEVLKQYQENYNVHLPMATYNAELAGYTSTGYIPTSAMIGADGVTTFFDSGARPSAAFFEDLFEKALAAAPKPVEPEEKPADGLVNVDGTWYVYANGQVASGYSGFAMYNDFWFMIKDGMLDLNANGFYDYNGATFLFTAGQLRSDFSGLMMNVDGRWYFVTEGRFAKEYTGVAMYGDAWFYLENGMLAENFTGEIEYGGEKFSVVSGQLVI